MRQQNNNKEKAVSVRLNADTHTKLEYIMKSRGVNASDAIRLCINTARIINIGDSKGLARDFCRIRVALENNSIDAEIGRQVNALCQCMCDVLQQTEDSAE